MKYSSIITALIFTGSALVAFAQKPTSIQTPDKAKYVEYKPGYYQNSILKGIEDYEKKTEVPKTSKAFKVDLSQRNVPKSVNEFTKYWSNTPVSQGNTGSCWCFSTTAFFESEIYRLKKEQVKLSEMWTVYWEYVEKADYFVETRGASLFDEGSEGNAVNRIWKKYGVVPLKDYTGLQPGQTVHNHETMVEEMKTFLKSIKETQNWNKPFVLSTIKSILNHYMTEPPTTVTVNNKTYTPQEYLNNVLGLVLDDYVDLMSLVEKPYYTKALYNVPDNWWKCDDYYNVPLDEYMQVVKTAIRKGYTIAIGGDVSEAGFDSYAQCAVIPTFDIPSAYIDENARQMRFSNKTTTDDHGMQLIGYLEKDGKDWYLIKDSGAGSRNCGKDSENFGYYFFHEDYIKLKIMDFMVHKDMVKDLLAKMKK